ncbi:MAG: membrane integrity-associated transporter subunit PqiC, partial [Gammaproteobacteria bacterium]|nr:membrane integrity-associated transporter subunit PqiC [Gammaproteobacteria bacterium]
EITQTARAVRSLADHLDRHPEALIRGRLRSHAMTPRLIPVLLILTLSACASSPPTRFFALDAVAPGASPAAQRAGGTSAPVKVDAVHIPPALDRESMVRGASGNQLEISSQDRWAGDLGEMIRRVLTQDLAARLPPGTVIAPDSPAPASARGIVLDILTFQPQSGEVVLDADWTLVQGTQSNPVLRRSLRLTEAAAASAQGQAAAMSKLLGELAGRMAADIAEASRSGGR